MADIRGYCTLCRSRCGAIYTVQDGTLTGVRPDPDHPTGAALCAKGRAAPEIAHSARRLTRPLRRTNPKDVADAGWQEIGWEEAMGEVANRLDRIRAVHGAESVAFAVTSPSGTPLSDSIDWVERFIRLFGSPNICYSTEICNWHKDFAHEFTFGSAIGSPEYQNAELTLLWGHNPAASWLDRSTAIAESTSSLAVVDPRRSGSAVRADHWLPVRPGADAALALGIANLLLTAHAEDTEFVRAWTNAPLLVRVADGRFLRADELEAGLDGFVVWDEQGNGPARYDTRRPAEHPDRFALHGRRRVRTRRGAVDCVPVRQLFAEACGRWDPARTSEVTWVPERDIRALADALGQANSVAYYAWSGVGQHGNATQIDRAIATLYALTGCVDAPGGNVALSALPAAPVTGQDQLAPEQRRKALGLARRPLGPPKQGWVTARDLCTAVLTGEPYPVRALVGFGSNLVVSQPDPRRTRDALRQLDFHVQADLFATPTTEFADIVLPVNSAWEREAIRIGFGSDQRGCEHVQLRQRMIEPVGESRSDTEIVFDLATRLGMDAEFFHGDIEAGWNHQLRPLGVSTDQLRAKPEGVRIELSTRYRKYAESTSDGQVTGFGTPTRRVELYSEQLAEHGYDPLPTHHEPAATPSEDFPVVLTCAKNGHFCHSQHRGISSLRKRSPEPTVRLSPELAAERGIADGGWVRLSTRAGAVRMRARLEESLHARIAVAEHGWWQPAPDIGLPGYDPLDERGSNYNLLVDDEHTDPVSGSVPMRSLACDVQPVDTAAPEEREFRVVELERRTPEVSSIALAPTDPAPLPDYRPGQHIALRLAGDEVSRSYSLIGSQDRRHYRVAVRRIEGGQLSGRLHEGLRVGDTLLAEGPSGVFLLPAELEFPVVLLAGGIGITPFLGYLETMAQGTAPEPPEIVLHHVSRDAEAHVFAGRIAELADRLPQLRVVNHYSRPRQADRGHQFTGRLSVRHIDPELIRRRARFYLCGPDAMQRELIDGLVSLGVPRFEIFTERFTPARANVRAQPGAEHTVRFARTGRELRWRERDGTLLEMARDAGIRLPSGCRLGQCESCAVGVLRGRIAHLVELPDELTEEQCLTCQAVPVSDVTLDA
ncbi:MAG: molybdopterin-dependent oxidoreductase [Pseudonocardiaceae bacterium]|nr:molybdopterin-dependent oxidoreductase [Pseudonocardiaceae bacterium]